MSSDMAGYTQCISQFSYYGCPGIKDFRDAVCHHIQTAKEKWRFFAMARLAGVDLPRDKRVEIDLNYIYGIG